MSTIDNSWIKLPRNFAKWRWYHDSNMVHLYLYLLLNANLEDEEFNQMTIHRGELYTSLPQLSSNTSLSIRSIRTCLEKLSKTKEIKYRASHQGRLIKLLDFNSFQPLPLDEDNPDWIKLSIRLCDWCWYINSKTVHLFIHLILNANIVIDSNERNKVQCKFSIRRLSEETGITFKCIKDCLKKLKSTSEIISESSHGFSFYNIIICHCECFEILNHYYGF